jgi:uncharacterized membrane protein
MSYKSIIEQMGIPSVTNQPFFFPSTFVGLMSIPLVLALIPRNRFYGIRMRKTLADDRVWYSANRFGGSLCLMSGAIYVGFATAWPMSGLQDPRFTLWLIHLGAFVVPLLTSVVWTMRYVHRL